MRPAKHQRVLCRFDHDHAALKRRRDETARATTQSPTTPRRIQQGRAEARPKGLPRQSLHTTAQRHPDAANAMLLRAPTQIETTSEDRCPRAGAVLSLLALLAGPRGGHAAHPLAQPRARWG